MAVEASVHGHAMYLLDGVFGERDAAVDLACERAAAATLALVEGLSSLTDLVFDLGELRDKASRATAEIDALIAQSDDHTEMVRQLEEQYEAGIDEFEGESDDDEPLEDADLPTGDQLIEELERYLRGETDQ